MFAAIREKLVGAWVKLRQGSLAKLFVFEFVVVMLGVLAAQWVADEARERADFRDMEEARARADLEMADAAYVAQGWTLVAPCMTEDIDAMLRAVLAEQEVAATSLKRPRLFTTVVMPLREQTKLLIRARYGDDVAYRYGRIERLGGRLNVQVETMLDEWGKLAILDPSFDTRTVGGRRRAVDTLIAIRSHLETLASVADGIINVADEMGLEPTVLGETGRLVGSCEEFREVGEMFIGETG